MSYALKIPNVDFSDIAVEQITFIDAVPCTAVTLSANTLSFDQAEETQTLTATLAPINTTDILSWASSDENVATVDSSGAVTIHGIGEAIITASCGSVSASATINQTTIKAAGTISVLEHYLIDKYNSNTVLGVAHEPSSTENTQYAIGNIYSGAADLRLLHGYEYGIEAIRVPYGATVARLITSDENSISTNYLYFANTMNLTDLNGTTYPTYTKLSNFVNLTNGFAVEFGQCFGLRMDSRSYRDVFSYFVFE